ARAVTAAQKSLAPARTDLSRRYAEALEQGATPETWSALADDAAAAKQPDLDLGALYFLPTPRLDPRRHRLLAIATHAPWYAALAEEKAADSERLRGEAVRAVERLTPLEAHCAAAPRVEDRCVLIERGIAYGYTLQHQSLRAREFG